MYEPPSFVQRNFSENVYVLIFNLDSEGLNSSPYTCMISAKTSNLDFFYLLIHKFPSEKSRLPSMAQQVTIRSGTYPHTQAKQDNPLGGKGYQE